MESNVSEFAPQTRMAPALEEREMFNNLIESDIHTAELKRQGSFVFGTLLAYAVLLLAAGVGSIYAYEARLDNQSLEMTALVTMVPVTAAPKNTPEQRAPARPRASNSAIADSTARVAMRTMSQTAVTDMSRTPTNIGVTGNNVPPMPPGGKIGPVNVDPGGKGNYPFNSSDPGGTVGPLSSGNELTKEPPPEMTKVESKPPKSIVKSLGVIESKITHKASPPYPEMAKRARVSGSVTVQILLDEEGRVLSAQATSGHPLLRGAAEKAAYQTRFSPTLLSNQPVKVSGFITFNFILQ